MASSYQSLPVRALRDLPIRNNPRLHLLDYRQTSAPGMAPGQKPRTHGHGSARMPGGLIVAVCVTQSPDGEWLLETQAAPYDEEVSQRRAMECSDQLLADLYRAVQQKVIAAQAGTYGRVEGKN